MASIVIKSNSLDDTLALGRKLGGLLQGGEVIELISDLGGGKTALVRGLALGIGSNDQVMSPTFTISRIYTGPKLQLHHFDFYRLSDPGIMKNELSEVLDLNDTVVAIEWSEAVRDVLPEDRLSVELVALEESVRDININSNGGKSDRLVEGLK